MTMAKCLVCGESFDRDKIAFHKEGRRYMHATCRANEDPNEVSLRNIHRLMSSIMGNGYNFVKIKQQLDSYIKESQFTLDGIYIALYYFYIYLENPVDKANGGIGIVPHVYIEAQHFVQNIEQAKFLNKDKTLNDFIPIVKEKVIPPPVRIEMKKHNSNFF